MTAQDGNGRIETLRLKVNGRERRVTADPDTPLLWVIREHLGLTGTKFGCGMSICGACTVHIDGEAVRSCVTQVSSVQGKEIITIEGIHATREGKAAQASWVAESVPQCGYCQAGQIMVAQPSGGTIVTIGDWAVARPYLNYGAYFISKGAIPAMTRMLAVELAHRNPAVRVNCIQHGPVLIPAGVSQAERDRAIAGTLVRREGRPEHIAQAVLFLVDNDFVTGVTLPVDGGRTIAGGQADPCEDGWPAI